MMVFRGVYALVPAMVLVLQGCVSTQALRSVSESQEVLRGQILAQGRQLEEQGFQLEMFSQSQGELNNLVSGLFSELEHINRQLARKTVALNTALAASKPSKPAKPPAKPKKPKSQSLSTAKDLAGKVVLGRAEWATLDILGATFEAELDTGVRRSALYVSDTQKFERDGKEWVRFQLVLPDAKDQKKTSFESPVASHVRVRVAAAPAPPEKRPTIKVTITMGALVEPAELVLIAVDKVPASLSLGRNFMRDIAVVDVARKFTQSKSK